jgi:hypothetical protein
MLNSSSIERPKSIITTPAAMWLTGCALIAPKIVPVREAIRPKAEYVAATPETKARLKRKPFMREPSAPAVINPTLIGIRGYTQGVKLSRTPAAKATR